MLLNRPLQDAAQKNLGWVGAPAYTEEDHQFARDLQTYLNIQPTGLSTMIEPLANAPLPTQGGSTDVAEVSWITPTVSLGVASAGKGLPWHSWATSASHGIPGAAKAAQVAARVLALTGVDLLTDPDLLSRAQDEFLEKTKSEPYQSPIPADQKPPLPR
jgi:aminobenzoyl-glutamate utilization protein B